MGSSAGLVSGDSLVYRHVLQEVGFLSEGFAAVITTEWLLARVCEPVPFQGGLV